MEEKKMSRLQFALLAALMFGLYIGYAVWLFWCQPFVACAAEKDDAVPGGSGNYLVYDAVTIYNDGDSKYIVSYKARAKEGYEIIGAENKMIGGGYNPIFINLSLSCVKISDGSYCSIDSSTMEEFEVLEEYYYEGQLKYHNEYTLNNVKYPTVTYYKNGLSPDYIITSHVEGIKIFDSFDSRDAYVQSGSLDGLANPSIDMGTLDKNIGYLHDLTWEPLQYGETDENGIPESFDDCFTWSDFYPEYDDTYLVEVRASCEVETKKWFGLSKGTVYKSNIRNLASGVPYKDLEFIISMEDERSVFADFINEYMPDESSLKSFGAVGAYRYDTYYFRIYKWDEELNSYRYGEWVRLTKDGTALMGSLENNVDSGYFDKNGNWITNIDSEYGEGKPGTAIVGSGSTKDEAKEDADSKKDKVESGDNSIDLSNTSFSELWEWFCKCLISFWNGIGVIPEFFGRVFSFLPSPVYAFIGLGIVAAIILRILGR